MNNESDWDDYGTENINMGKPTRRVSFAKVNTVKYVIFLNQTHNGALSSIRLISAIFVLFICQFLHFNV